MIFFTYKGENAETEKGKRWESEGREMKDKCEMWEREREMEKQKYRRERKEKNDYIY